VFAPGVVVPTTSQNVWCPVEGSRTIRSIWPEGMAVKKGFPVCLLDSSDFEARLASLDPVRDSAEAGRLRTQIERCQVFAPKDGVIVHGNDPDRPERRDIEKDAVVRERQLLFRVIDLDGPMAIEARVQESVADHVRPGLRARIRLDALVVLTGRVESIAPRPDPRRPSQDDAPVYTTRLSIDERPPWIRPGLSGRVEILLDQLEDALSVPREATIRYGGKDHVAVKRPDGGVDWREVVLGGRNDRVVEVRKGLRGGETVARNPYFVMSPEERREKLGIPAAKDSGQAAAPEKAP
jgi:hypothetical protein